ncbi:MAG: phage terminase large subunit family protein [Candidatus Omnitrophica bacterium]|nr:phage terminase large subunit family protein [Candidatus Omnitrophota bacterium]
MAATFSGDGLKLLTVGDEDTRRSVAAEINPAVWTIRYRTLKGKPYTFYSSTVPQAHRPFLMQPMYDQHPHKVTEKGRQIGMSENSLTEALWFPDQHPFTKVVYVFPRDKQVRRFSSTRIDVAIEQSPYLKSRMKSANVYQKDIGDSFLILSSAWQADLGEGIDADVLFIDEKDRMKAKVEIAFEESLKSSPYGYLREFSTPSIPNMGVDENYQKSDQHEWMVRCEACGMMQPITYPESFLKLKAKDGTVSYRFACTKKGCRGKLNRYWGEWVPKFAGRNIRGYHISQMLAPWISANKIMQNKEKYVFKQLFYNYVLGIPYMGDAMLVTEAMLDACVETNLVKLPAGEAVVAGVDWGDTSWMVIGKLWEGRPLIIDLIKIDSDDAEEHPKEVARMMQKYNVRLCVCDAGYGKDRNARLLKQFPGRIFSCYYPNIEGGSSKVFLASWQDSQAKVTVDRTVSLKLMLHAFSSGNLSVFRKLYGTPHFDEFKKHICNLVSVKELGDDGTSMHERIGALGPDHYGHATNYLTIAFEKVTNLPRSSAGFVGDDEEE